MNPRIVSIAATLAIAACAGNEPLLDKPFDLAASEWGTGSDVPYIQFAADGRVSGNGGCNRFSGTYTVEGDNLTFSPLAATKMACPNLQAESAFFQILGNTKRYSATHTVLVLKDESGNDLLALQRRDWD